MGTYVAAIIQHMLVLLGVSTVVFVPLYAFRKNIIEWIRGKFTKKNKEAPDDSSKK